MDFQNKERTALPSTCGEETDLPGVPAVGCVASIAFQPNNVHGVAAVITASCDGVHILGPDLEKLHVPRREHHLFTRTIWHIPVSRFCEGGAASDAEDVGARASSFTARGHHPRSRGHSGGSPATEKSGRGGAMITSLVAFLVAAGSTVDTPTSSGADTVCACLSWIDARGTHHVSSIFFSLLAALTRSMTTAADLRLRTHLDVLPSLSAMERRGAVLRLFYNAHFVRHAAAERAARHHIVMCSCYHLERKALPAAEGVVTPEHAPLPAADVRPAGTGTVTAAAPRVRKSTVSGEGGGAEPRVKAAPSTASTTAAGRKGWLAFIKVAWGDRAAEEGGSFMHAGPSAAEPWLDKSGADSSDGESTERLTGTSGGDSSVALSSVTEACEPDVAPWLWRFQPGRVVLSFNVQGPHAPVIAAAGTADGRIVLLSAQSDRVVRRLVGPISDIGFVDTRPSHGEASVRSRLVDGVLRREGATACAASKDDASVSTDSVAALDSAGNVIVIHGVNTPNPTSRMVADIPQLITLKDAHSACASFVDSPDQPTSAVGDETDAAANKPVSAKSFVDLSTLRKFFSSSSTGKRGRQPSSTGLPPAGASPGTVTAPPHAHLPHLSSTPVRSPPGADGEAEAGHPNSTHGGQSKKDAAGGSAHDADFHLSGHLLSRGLLYGTWITSTRGCAELVVTTLGHAIVSIPFDPDEGTFAIAGFTMTPTPMNYIGFIDFFNTGAPELVLTSAHSVLVARSSRDVLRQRAALLARILRARGSVTDLKGSPNTLKKLGLAHADSTASSRAAAASRQPLDDFMDILET